MQPIGNNSYRLSDHEIHFTLVEFFRGGSKAAQEAIVFTGSGGGDCGYPFVIGTNYLVYAFTNNGRLMTSICSETAPEVMVSGALRELRALRDTGHVDDLFGTIGIAPRGGSWEDLVTTRPLANISVYASGRKRGKRFETKQTSTGSMLLLRCLPAHTRSKRTCPLVSRRVVTRMITGYLMPRSRSKEQAAGWTHLR